MGGSAHCLYAHISTPYDELQEGLIFLSFFYIAVLQRFHTKRLSRRERDAQAVYGQDQQRTSSTSTCTIFSMEATGTNSWTPWKLAPPVAEKARRFRGSVPVFTPQRGWKPADTTVFRIAEAPPVAYFSQQFFLFVSDGILFVNSDKKYAKNAARNRWFLDFLSSQELRSLWAVKGIDCATNPLPLPLR